MAERPLPAPPLRVAHVALVRPGFKGDAAAAVRRSRDGLLALLSRAGADAVIPDAGAARHPRDGQPFPAGVVTDAAEAGAVAAELANAGADLVLLQHVTFATGELVAPLIEASPRLAVWALPEPGPGHGPLPFNALCGMQMTLSMLDAPPVGRGGPVRWFHGEVAEARFTRPFLTTLAALRAVRAVETGRVLRIGGTAPGFYALEETPEAHGSATVVDASLEQLYRAIEDVPEAEAERRAARAAAGHDVEVDPEILRRGARIEAALERMADDAGAQALAVRCWPELPDRCDAMACAAMGTLASTGRPAACEGDAMGALSMLALQAAAESSAILMDLSDLDEADDALLLWHCGNAPAAWADPDGPRPRLTTHFNRDGVGPVRDETLRPGPITGFRLMDRGRSGVIAGGTLAGAARDGFDGVRGWWRAPVWADRPLPARRFFAELLEQRVPHHLAFVHGDHRAALSEACGWLGARVRTAGDRPFAAETAGVEAPS